MPLPLSLYTQAKILRSLLMRCNPFQPTWDSIQQNYKMPQWFVDAKFGLFIHLRKGS